ncbi:TPA: N-acetyltransferase [bacterium]|nr:N-acetyltransferase [bacterium]
MTWRTLIVPIEYINVVDPDSNYVAKFHDNVLVEAFPDFYVREDIPLLRKNLKEGTWCDHGETCRYHLIVAKKENNIVGGVSFYFFSFGDYAIGMGSYIGVKKEHRRGGIGIKLIDLRDKFILKDARELGQYTKGLIIQVNDPSLMKINEIRRDSMDPWKREMFWRRRGYKKIAFDFIQPAIKPEYPPIEYLSLHLYPYSKEWSDLQKLSRDELSNIIYCFVRCTGTVGPLETDPAYMRMKSELAEQDFFAVI